MQLYLTLPNIVLSFVFFFLQIVHAFTVAMLLALSLSSITLADAKPPSFSPGNGVVSCRDIWTQIRNQTSVPLSHTNSNTESIRSLVVCNKIVTYHTCKKHTSCGKSVRVMYEFDCFPNNRRKVLICGFPGACC